MLSLVERWLRTSDHPEQVYRRCMGLLRLTDKYPVHRLNAACERTMELNLNHLKRIRSLLDSNLDQSPMDVAPATTSPRQEHENLRDPATFH